MEPKKNAPVKLTANELMALGQLAGYTKAQVAQMLLDADDARRAESTDQP